MESSQGLGLAFVVIWTDSPAEMAGLVSTGTTSQNSNKPELI